MQHARLSADQLEIYPALDDGAYEVTSPADPDYNCAAWAVGDVTNWWWPTPDSEYYWPSGARTDGTLDAMIEGLNLVGFVECEIEDAQEGYETIAIYAIGGDPRHLARRLPDGRWTSKLGMIWEDIAHATLENLESDSYGTVTRYMRRPIATQEAI